MKKSIRTYGLLRALLGVPLLAVVFTADAAETDIRAAGAKGDGVSDDTAAIQRAIDSASEQGGGIVRIPAGEFVAGTVLLKDGVTLHLEDGAVLLGSTNIANYIAPDKFRSGNNAEMGFCFIGAVGAKNVGLTGKGVIDGRGKELLDQRPRGVSARPFLARFVRCDGVRIEDVSLRGSAAWTVHFSESRNVDVRGVTINCRGLGNNDGIDIDSSQDVRIRDCDIDTGDDAICLKATSLVPCRNVEISNCRLKSRWAAIKFGTESAANFEDVKISNCHIRDTQGGGVKLHSVDGAKLRNVLITDLVMENVNFPVFIRLGARLRTFREGDPRQPVGTVSNVVVRNLKATATSSIGIMINGIPGHTVNDVRFENIEISLPGGGTRDEAAVRLEERESAYPEITMFGRQFPAYGLYARHVNGLKVDRVRFDLKSADQRPAIVCIDAARVDLENWKLPITADADTLVRLESVRDSVISDFDVNGVGKKFVIVEGQGNRAIELRNNKVQAGSLFTADPGIVTAR